MRTLFTAATGGPWHIQLLRQAPGMIRYTGQPGFTARWYTGPVDPNRPPEHTDPGSGDDDAIHFYQIIWHQPVTAQHRAKLFTEAAELIDAQISRQL